MPIIKSAKKKLKQDRRRHTRNLKHKQALKQALKKAGRTGAEKDIKTVYRLTNRAKNKGIIHKNKAKRIKERFSKKAKK